jgi:endonuclease III
MTAISRTAQFAKVHKTLKKHYKSSPCNTGRSVIEHLLFACCLEDAHHDAAEEAYAALVHTFFDWNEVRVTSISELSEVMACLPDPRAAANRIKRILHSVFEATFNFDLDEMRKKNLGPTVKWLEKLDGATHFTVAYMVQAGLGGHSIPIDTGTMAALHVLDLVTDKDVTDKTVPGLERAVAKSKGIEFGSLIHELGADYSANPYSPSIRDILMQINPECASRLPKRRADRSAQKPPEPSVPAEPAKEAKTTDAKGKSAAAEKPAAKKKSTEAPSIPSQAEPPKKKPAGAHEPLVKPAPAEKPHSAAVAAKKKPASEPLPKRKPR